MSRGLTRESSVSVIITYLYLGILAALFAGGASVIYTSFQPTRLPNPGVAAYHVPAALELYPLPRPYSSPAPEVAADAELQPALSVTGTATGQVQREPSPQGPAPKKSKQTASRPRDPRDQFFMTYTQFHSYGYFRPWPTERAPPRRDRASASGSPR
jgi:hypothetical protein